MFVPPPLPRALEASVRDLGSTRAEIRASAVADLVRHALQSDATRARAIPLLDRALRDDFAPVRAAAAVALADLRATEALGSLQIAIEDADPYVRQMALNALGEIGDPRAAQRLRRALGDARPEVRYQATIAYARVAEGTPSDVTAALVAATDDDDEAVRYIALRLAEERLDATAAPLDPAIAERARALLADPAAAVVVAAAIVLAKSGDPEGRGVVARIVAGDRVAGRHPEKEDEQEAVELAGVLGLRDVVPALERRAWGLGRVVRDTCAFHAKIALARLGHARAEAEILRDLESPRRATRAAAIVAAGRAHLHAARERIARLRGSPEHELVVEALARLAVE